MPINKKKIAVIGSGFGGLAAAIRLQAAGYAVTLFEKRDKPGGRAYHYQDQGFLFDAGPTVITAPQCLEELFTISQKNMDDYVTLLPVSPLYRLLWDDGFRFDYTNSLGTNLAQIRAVSETDAEGYVRFLQYSKDVFNEGYTKLAHVPFLRFWDMVKVSPQLLRLGAYRSVYHRVAKYVEDPHLRQAFSFHSLLVGGNPFQTSSLYTLIHYLEQHWGVFFPKGGTARLVAGLVALFQDLGGTIRLNSPVEQIVTQEGKIKGILLKNEPLHECSAVVSNADVVHTYACLLDQCPEALPKARALSRSSYSMSLFLIYFGTNRTYPELAHHNVLFGPRYKELLNEIFYCGTLAEDFSLYLHAPTRTDASVAPAGCESFYVLSPVPHLGKGKIDWQQEAEPYAERILSYLERTCLPDLKKHLVTKRLFTPLDFKNELNAHLGSAFSLEPRLSQSAYYRVHNKDDRIAGLYFVGAGTHPGAGVPGVVNSAKATAVLVERDLRQEGYLIP